MKLSVVVPVYNAGSVLRRCLESLRKQNFCDLEFILIDDGSTDDSAVICEEYSLLDPRFHLFRQENQGVSVARNHGISVASGEYITFVDADDFLVDDAYEIAMDGIGDSDALFFGYREYYERQDHYRVISPERTGIVSKDEALYQCLLPIGFGYFTSVWNKIFRSELIRKISFKQDLKIGEDEFWLHEVMQKMGKITLINDALYNYVQSENSILHSEYRLSEKWLTAIEAKRRSMELIDNDSVCFEISRSKFFDDLFQLLWFAYVDDDKKGLEFMKGTLSPFRNSFYDSDLYSRKKKFKYSLIEKMIRFRVPKSIVKFLGSLKTYRIKMILGGE